MHAAWVSVFGEEPDTRSDAVCAQMNDAWTLAKTSRFFVGVANAPVCLACGRAACGFRDDVNLGKCVCGRYPATPAPTSAGYPVAP
jgi:hypothetical protein